MEDDKESVQVLPEYLLPPHTAPLVKRIPIKMNKKMKGLSLLQFPTSTSNLSGPIKAEIKKENKKIKLYTELDKRGIVYNKANDIDKLEYSSTLMGVNTNYFVGIIQEGELHLNKLEDIYQLRVNLNQLKTKKTEDVEDMEEEEDKKATTGSVTSKLIGIQAQASGDKPALSSVQDILRKDEDEAYLGYGWREFDVGD